MDALIANFTANDCSKTKKYDITIACEANFHVYCNIALLDLIR
jgi:hypothetical protein